MKAPVVSARIVALFCICCLCLPFFGALLSQPSSVELAVEMSETITEKTIANTTVATSSATSGESEVGETTASRQTTTTTAQPATSTSAITVTSAATTVAVYSEDITTAAQTTQSEPKFVPFDKPITAATLDLPKYMTFPEIMLPNSMPMGVLKHNGENYVYTDTFSVMAEGFSRVVQYDLREQPLDDGGVLTGILLTVSARRGDGQVKSLTISWHDESPVKKPTADTSHDRLFVSDNPAVSPLRVYVGYWGGGINSKYCVHYGDLAAAFRQLEQWIVAAP